MKQYKAYAKVNIFLKITGTRGEYHEIFSRFMRVKSLYDQLSFVPKSDLDAKMNQFTILGDFDCETSQNTIYKAYVALKEYTKSSSLENLMQTHAIKVEKNIPAYAGLGGGSSDAATFLKMCNGVLDLDLSLNELAQIGVKVGADVPFFIYGYDSANVSGIGEVVEPYDEEPLAFEVFTPDVKISTPRVYKAYRENFYDPIDGFEVQKLKDMDSKKVLTNSSATEANDLFVPAIQEYPELKEHYKQGYFFSGSGSSFFKVEEENNG
ncbi:MAG: 4-(cytidine 5'-diphospho)-2-C-methyl-D-erythritol kinase [Sulfurimonas sp.]